MSSFPTNSVSRYATIQDAEGKPKVAKIPMPALIPGFILVKPSALVLDPGDHNMGAAFPAPGAVIGSNFISTVVAIGPDTETNLVPGDYIAGGCLSAKTGHCENGAFATYICSPAVHILRITATV